MEKFFKLKEHNTTVKTEVIAGITTFMTMAYILAANPYFLSKAGMDAGALFTATALSAGIATLVMALVAKLPFALAPGMGLNAFFAFTVVLGMGYSWQTALTAVFLEGIIFIILTFFNIREAIINCIPANLKKAIAVGIGLFIAFIGLYNNNNGVVITGQGIPLTLGDISWGSEGLLIVIGLVVTGALLVWKVKGALLFGILITTVFSFIMGTQELPEEISFSIPSLEPLFFKLEWDKIFSLEMLGILFTFLLVDMFDTVGTLVGVCTKADMMVDGKVPNAKKALLADAVGTTAGALLGTSTVTTFVESASGVSEGGRTGLTSLTTALLFFVSLLLFPVFALIPGAATAPALIMVGLFMMSPVKDINWSDYTEAIPAFLTVIMMPLSYSIAEGIAFGILAFVILKLISGRRKEIPVLSYFVGLFFIADFVYKAIG